MKSRINYLINDGTITAEDGRIMFYIAKGKTNEGISFIDLTGLKQRLETYLTKATNKNQIKLYVGLIRLVDSFIKEWNKKENVCYKII